MMATASNGPSASGIFRKRSALFETWVTWLKPKAITLISASAGATRPSRCAQRRSRDCIKADVHDERSVADALADAYGAVNAVSLYVEQGRETFHSAHVEFAQRVAAQAQRAGVKRLIHVSGIGANPRSQSPYIRKRGEGELAVRAAFADAILVRPAVMFGSDDGFLTTILKLLDRLAIYPMFGNGQMRLQPVYAEDVGQAIAKMLQRAQTRPIMFECDLFVVPRPNRPCWPTAGSICRPTRCRTAFN